MSRYIDSYAVCELFEPFVDAFTDVEVTSAYVQTLTLLANAPSIDIVRCKECKFWIGHISDDDGFDEGLDECRWRDSEAPDADDFCSYGERKNNAD